MSLGVLAPPGDGFHGPVPHGAQGLAPRVWFKLCLCNSGQSKRYISHFVHKEHKGGTLGQLKLSTLDRALDDADLKPPAPATTCRGSPRICCDRRRARRRPAAARKRPAQPLLGPAAAGRAAAQRVERTEPAQSGASRERPRPPRRRRPRPTVVANQRGAVQRGQVLPGSRQQRLVAWAARPFETARGAVRDLSRRHGALYHP